MESLQRLFELSKKNNFKIYGLNSEGSLSERDKSAARSISKLHQHNPDSQILFSLESSIFFQINYQKM